MHPFCGKNLFVLYLGFMLSLKYLSIEFITNGKQRLEWLKSNLRSIYENQYSFKLWMVEILYNMKHKRYAISNDLEALQQGCLV